MQITSKGQVTIPAHIREALGFLPNTEVEFKIARGRAYIEKANKPFKRGKSIVERMKGQATVKMSTQEILALTREEK